MSEQRCARCDWRGDDEGAVEHALEAGHPRCVVCQRRSLTVHEAQTCGKCIGRVRADLADIATEAALVPQQTVQGLTLLGDGTMQRHARPEELSGQRFSSLHQRDIPASGHPLTADDDKIRSVSVRDEWPSDPLPVLPALASWEDMVREEYRDPKGPAATLSATVDYLNRHLEGGHNLAQTFHAFDEMAAEIRRHHSAIKHGAGLADIPVRAPVSCFDCGGQLIRTYGDKGLTDDWTCSECRGVYSQAEYYLAMRAELERRAGEAS